MLRRRLYACGEHYHRKFDVIPVWHHFKSKMNVSMVRSLGISFIDNWMVNVWCLVLCLGFGADEAGPSGLNDYVEQDENDDKMENDADSVQVQFLSLPGRLESVRWVVLMFISIFFRKKNSICLSFVIRLLIHLVTQRSKHQHWQISQMLAPQRIHPLRIKIQTHGTNIQKRSFYSYYGFLRWLSWHRSTKRKRIITYSRSMAMTQNVSRN